jgi:hypothetical protein
LAAGFNENLLYLLIPYFSRTIHRGGAPLIYYGEKSKDALCVFLQALYGYRQRLCLFCRPGCTIFELILDRFEAFSNPSDLKKYKPYMW